MYISNLCFSEELNDKISIKLNKELKSSATSKELKKLKEKDKKEFSVKQTWRDNSSIHKYSLKKKIK